MTEPGRLRIAIQKSGRLAEKSVALFAKCGLDLDFRKDRLLHKSADFPVDLMLVRDDDIPEYVADGVCDLGVVGENILHEKHFSRPDAELSRIEVVTKLGFGACRLSLAVPTGFRYESPFSLNGKKIATSYPSCLREFLKSHDVDAQILELSGSVEIAPALQIADAICDLVSTGATLQSNGLSEVTTILTSQACLVRNGRPLEAQKAALFERLQRRINGVIKAGHSKYIMMNAPLEALEKIREILPGMEEPSVIPLSSSSERVAIHAVAGEDVFWETIENLKAAGASSILVLPIEKVIA